MSAARRHDRRGKGHRGKPDRFDRRKGGGLPRKGFRSQPVPQYSEELAKAAAKAAIKSILKEEPPEKTIGRLRSMGLNNKLATATYAHAREQVRITHRRAVAVFMIVGAVLLFIGVIIAAIQNRPGPSRPWHWPWVGFIFAVIGLILMAWGYIRWRKLIRSG